MLYDLQLAWRNIRGRTVQTIVTLLVVGLSVALFVSVTHLNDGLQRGIIRASDPFGVLVVGAKGSSQQLVLSTLLLQSAPIGNLPMTIYEQLEHDPRVKLAVPLALGDNVGGARIIGTNEHFFELRPSQLEPPSFQLVSGRLFQAEFEALLGSKAAASLGLQIGDQFLSQHGVSPGLERDMHAERYTVVGILRPSHTAFDNTVMTTVESVLEVHRPHEKGETRQEEGESAEPDPQVTAILLLPSGFVEANQLWQEFYTGTEAQAVFPGKELGGLFDLLDQGQSLLRIVGYLAAIMAALTLFLAIYSATGSRDHLLAIMRGLGARRITLLRVVLFETVLIALLGALVGRLLGCLTAIVIATQITQRSAIPVAIRYLPQLEAWLWLVPLVLGVVAGLLPAWQAYRSNMVEKLFTS